jgi:transcriptional regulator
MSDELLQEICEKLDHLVLLTSASTVKGLKPNEAIVILGEVGLDRNVIARIVGTTAATVSVRLSEARARKKGKAVD